MKIKEEKSMEEIHRISEKMYNETSEISLHEKMIKIAMKAESFKAECNLSLKPASQKLKPVKI